jgi:hypothetical protein
MIAESVTLRGSGTKSDPEPRSPVADRHPQDPDRVSARWRTARRRLGLAQIARHMDPHNESMRPGCSRDVLQTGSQGGRLRFTEAALMSTTREHIDHNQASGLPVTYPGRPAPNTRSTNCATALAQLPPTVQFDEYDKGVIAVFQKSAAADGAGRPLCHIHVRQRGFK